VANSKEFGKRQTSQEERVSIAKPSYQGAKNKIENKVRSFFDQQLCGAKAGRRAQQL